MPHVWAPPPDFKWKREWKRLTIFICVIRNASRSDSREAGSNIKRSTAFGCHVESTWDCFIFNFHLCRSSCHRQQVGTVPAGQMGNARRQLIHCSWVFCNRQRRSHFRSSNLSVNVLGRRVSRFVCLCNFDNCTDNSSLFSLIIEPGAVVYLTPRLSLLLSCLCVPVSLVRADEETSAKSERDKRSKSTFAFHHSARDPAELPIASLDSRQLQS